MQEPIRYCTTADGVRIAYTTSGSRPAVVRVLGWLTHLEFEREGPFWTPWVRALGRDHRLVRYDGRGMGLSDRDTSDFSVEARVRDLTAVVDALAIERFALIGTSDGGAPAIAYAAAHPERVTRLVLHGAYHRPNSDTGWSEEDTRALLQLVRTCWGIDVPAFRQIFTSLQFPDADETFARWYNELQRVSATPDVAARFIATLWTTDVRPLLPLVRAPTLVTHRAGDMGSPFAYSRELAATIPNALLLPLSGRNHLPLPHEPEVGELFSAIVRFLAADRSSDGTVGPTARERCDEFHDAAGRSRLTPREAEVLRLIAAGCSTLEIAAALVISDHTVERHVTNLYGKIGATNRADATAFAFRHGLADSGDRPYRPVPGVD